jgi:hypothetical protein
MHSSILSPLKRVCSAPRILCMFVLVGCAMSQEAPVRLDSSDWWSYTRQEELPVPQRREPIRFQNREPSESNFQVAGLALGATWDFAEIRSKFGTATEVERGDAASGRNQICYVSPSGGVHLIYELGEVDAVFYLFVDGTKWNGSQFCAVSEEVSANISTASGLRLGLPPQQVKGILGDPSIATPTKLVYYFSYKRRTPPEALARLRQNYPDMSDAEFIQSFEYADTESYIEARFASGKLNYLAISKSETY